MITLRLTLKNIWFQLIRRGIKKEEYRDISPYYQTRLCANYDAKSMECQGCKTNYCRPVPKFDEVHFTLGYPTDQDLEKHMVVKTKGLRKGWGRPLWGCSPSKRVFIIDLEN